MIDLWLYNLPIFRRSYRALSPDGNDTEEISKAYEVSMSNPSQRQCPRHCGPGILPGAKPIHLIFRGNIRTPLDCLPKVCAPIWGFLIGPFAKIQLFTHGLLANGLEFRMSDPEYRDRNVATPYFTSAPGAVPNNRTAFTSAAASRTFFASSRSETITTLRAPAART